MIERSRWKKESEKDGGRVKERRDCLCGYWVERRERMKESLKQGKIAKKGKRKSNRQNPESQGSDKVLECRVTLFMLLGDTSVTAFKRCMNH